MSILRVNTCARCKHAVRMQDLECRRYPPQINSVAVTMIPPGGSRPETVIQQTAAFPHVNAEAFCSEWAPAFEIANENAMNVAASHLALAA